MLLTAYLSELRLMYQSVRHYHPGPSAVGPLTPRPRRRLETCLCAQTSSSPRECERGALRRSSLRQETRRRRESSLAHLACAYRRLGAEISGRPPPTWC